MILRKNKIKTIFKDYDPSWPREIEWTPAFKQVNPDRTSTYCHYSAPNIYFDGDFLISLLKTIICIIQRAQIKRIKYIDGKFMVPNKFDQFPSRRDGITAWTDLELAIKVCLGYNSLKKLVCIAIPNFRTGDGNFDHKILNGKKVYSPHYKYPCCWVIGDVIKIQKRQYILNQQS